MDLLETENFGYKLATEEEGIKVFDNGIDFSGIRNNFVDLLAVSSSGYLACSNSQLLVLDKIEVIEREEAPKSVSGFTKITQVVFNHDQSQLLVIDNGNLLILSSTDFANPARDAFKSQLSISGIVSILPSQQHNGILVLSEEKSLYLIAGETKKEIHKEVGAYSWTHPQDKVIIGNKNTVSVCSCSGQISLTVAVDDGLDAVSVISVSETIILASFSDSLDSIQSFAIDIVSQSSESVDVAPSYAEVERKNLCYSQRLLQWINGTNITFVISSKSTAIDTILHEGLKTSFIEQINETERAQMPLDDEGDDATSLGLALDLTHLNTKVLEVSTSIDEATGVLPKIWCLTHMGSLVAWWVFAVHEVKDGSASLKRAAESLPQLPLPVDGKETTSEPASSISEAKVEEKSISNTSLSEKKDAPAFGGTGFGSSGFGNSVSFGASQALSSGFGQTAFSLAKKNTDESKPAASSTNKSSNFAKFSGTGSSFASLGSNKSFPFGSTNGQTLIFGRDAKTENPLVFGGQKSIFGGLLSTGDQKSIFDQQSSDSQKFIFGGQQPKGEQKSIFEGQQSTGKQNSIFGQQAPGELKSIFGQPVSGDQKPVFGGQQTTNEPKLIFSQPAESKSLIFGGKISTEEQKLIFGQAASEQKLIFGSEKSSGEQKLIFGAKPDDNQKLPFGSDANKSKQVSWSDKSQFSSGLKGNESGDLQQETKNDLPFAKLNLKSLNEPKLPSPFEQLNIGKDDKPSPFASKLGTERLESPFAKLSAPKDESDAPKSVAKESSPFPGLSSLSVDSKPDSHQSPFGKITHQRQPSESKPAFSFGATESLVVSSSEEDDDDEEDDDTTSEASDDEFNEDEYGDNNEHPNLAGLNPSSLAPQKIDSPKTDTDSHFDKGEQAQNDTKINQEPSTNKLFEPEKSLKLEHDLLSEYEIIDKEEADGYVSVPTEVQLLSYDGPTRAVGSEKSISGMMEKIFQETSGYVEILRQNQLLLEHFLDSHSIMTPDVTLDETSQWTLAASPELHAQISKTIQEMSGFFKSVRDVDEQLTKLQERVQALQKNRVTLEKRLAQLETLTENRQALSLENRPLDSRGEMMREQLRRKVKNIKDTYNDALKLLMPLKAQQGYARDMVVQLEKAVVQVSRRVHAKHFEVEQLSKDIQELKLNEHKLIEPKFKLSYNSRRKWHDYYSI